MSLHNMISGAQGCPSQHILYIRVQGSAICNEEQCQTASPPPCLQRLRAQRPAVVKSCDPSAVAG
jgi:hypothetical protein